MGLPWWLSGKETACHCRRHRFDPWIRKTPLEKGMAFLLQYSCLGNPKDREAWRTTVHGATKESDITYRQNNNNIYRYIDICIHIHTGASLSLSVKQRSYNILTQIS